MKKITFVNGDHKAILQEREDGRVEVERDGNCTIFSSNHTFESVEETFLANGWKQETEDVFQVAVESSHAAVSETVRKRNKVSQELQQQIDAYVDLHGYMSKLKANQDRLKKLIRKYMENNNITELESSQGKKISLVDAVQSNSVSTFSNYDLNDIRSLLTGDILDEVTELRVNSDKLDALVQLGKIDLETAAKVESKRITVNGTPRFVVKK
ncbi:hypothetical protein Bp8pC_040 [Bacillus phage Bp8p-C]|uniref:Uncharacterized protein n=2 Tax=Agatevirus Bp8pC TaxID=1910937 RepID=A0A0A0PUM5_9CAUD|nr:hypothetical protein AXJ20_gp040 [Bacillus phage Bp8p-C]YP_009784341.1 hypothetical protein QLX39_gp040 [Bacillus phage Bp8p-T]AHJ87471.1 hypothetical protein Bp8pC_040 [Bacillus phage Bp8p-C]AHJ87682.1 hypothetical protein Bp8pT_040 [Bacillus phage Bp8p-T]